MSWRRRTLVDRAVLADKIAAVRDAHIHRAPAGSPGPVVIGFNPAVNGLSGCVSADPDLIKTIRQNPEGFYVNVHTAEFPAGAVRGQLSHPGD